MPLPRIPPIVPRLTRAVPTGSEWVFELKLDGFRGVLYVDRGHGYFVSKGARVMARFQTLADALASELPVLNAILDGEIIVMGEAGPDFNALFYRRGQAEYAAFDLLWLNGRDLRSLPLRRRKKALAGVVESAPVGYVPDTDDAELFCSAVERDLEGIVAKRWREPYATEVEWLKVKHAGYSQAVGRWELFRARRRSPSQRRM